MLVPRFQIDCGMLLWAVNEMINQEYKEFEKKTKKKKKTSKYEIIKSNRVVEESIFNIIA